MSSKSDTKVTETKRTEPTTTMATTFDSGSGSSTLETDIWAGSEPAECYSEKVATIDLSKTYWNKLYSLIGAQSFDEPKKRKIRAAVYSYCALNGTSRAGDYTNPIKTSFGFTFHPSAIAKACDLKNLRKWMRLNSDEAYSYFDKTGYLQKQPMFIVKVTDAGFDASSAIGACDFMSECPRLTVNERRLSNALFAFNITKARGVRGGETLEAVEDKFRDHMLRAQSNDENGNVINM